MVIDGLVDAARAKVREVTPSTIVGAFDDYLVLDVRELQEVLHGYLHGAINVPRGTIEMRITDDARFRDRRRPILVYSASGKRSVLAALTLSQLGFSDVQSLAGGIDRWSRENLPIE